MQKKMPKMSSTLNSLGQTTSYPICLFLNVFDKAKIAALSLLTANVTETPIKAIMSTHKYRQNYATSITRQ